MQKERDTLPGRDLDTQTTNMKTLSFILTQAWWWRQGQAEMLCACVQAAFVSSPTRGV